MPDFKMYYSVNREIACHYSPVLAKACWAHLDGEAFHIDLEPFEYPAAFGFVQHWMYNQQLLIPDSLYTTAHSHNCSITWILAAQLQMPKLQNAVIRRLFSGMVLHKSVTNYVYKQFGGIKDSDNKLRQLLVDRFAFDCPPNKWKGILRREGLSRGFIVNVALAYKRDGEMLHSQMHGWILPSRKVLRVEDYLVPEGDVIV